MALMGKNFQSFATGFLGARVEQMAAIKKARLDAKIARAKLKGE